MNGILAILPKPDGNYYFDNFGEALVYALIGFLIVFIGITLIIFIIWLVGLLLRKTNNFAFLTKLKKKDKSGSEKGASVNAENDGEIPDEVKAAIVAAIMAYYVEEKPECEFRVKRIRRI